MARDRAVTFDLTGGIDRRSNPLTRMASRFLDILNLLPRSPNGAQIVRKETSMAKTVSGVLDMAPMTRSAGTLAIITRSGSAYTDAIGGTCPAPTYQSACVQHQMAPYRGKLAIAQQAARIQVMDLDGNSMETESEGPKGGLCCEYKTMLLCGGDVDEDDSSPTVSIPLICVAIPPPQILKLFTGSADVVFTEGPPQTATVTDGASQDLTSSVGKWILIGGRLYSILSVDSVHNYIITVAGYNETPESVTGEAYIIYDDAPLIAIPGPNDALDMGQVYLFNDSGAAQIRVFNRSMAPITVTAARVSSAGAPSVDGSASPAQVRIENLPVMPFTIPPTGSMAFKVIFDPQAKGVCATDIVIDHDCYAQNSIQIPISCTGSNRQVLGNPSIVNFGAWMYGATSPAMSIQIQNTLTDSVILKQASWSGPGTNFAIVSMKIDNVDVTLDGTTKLPVADITLNPNKTLVIKITFTPPSGASGLYKGALAFKRVVPAKPFRIWRSDPGDPTSWDRDNAWMDFSGDSQAGGQLRCITSYDDAVIVHRDASVWMAVPGGLGGSFRAIQMALGEGVGAYGPHAVCTGGGAMWWAAKAGAYRLLGQGLNRISDPIEDLFRALAENQYSSVRVTYYDNMLFISMPTTSAHAAAIWVYSPDSPDSNGSWWCLDYSIVAMCTDKGATRKEHLYAFIGSALYRMDDAYAAGVSYTIRTPLITAGDPDTLKAVLGANLFASLASMITSITMRANNGAVSPAALYPVVSAAQLSGMALYHAGIGVIDTGPHGYDSGALTGGTVYVAGTAKTIAGNTETTITLSSVVVGLPDGFYNYSVTLSGGETVPLTNIKAYFPPSAVGSSFSMEVKGVSQSAVRNDLSGMTIAVGHVCKESEADSIRL